MEIIVVVLLVLILAVMAYLVVRKPVVAQDKDDGRSMMLLQNQIQELSRALEQRLGEGNRSMNESVKTQFEQSQRLMSNITDRVSQQLLEVTKGVTETNASTRQIFTIAEQLQNLEKVLKHQKQRGNLGERVLELTLSNVLAPGDYKMQYQFPGGETVDAVIVTKEGMIPIDAKFSLDNYNRVVNETDETRRLELEKDFKNDLKLRIDETSKYVRPKDGTLPFAFMSPNDQTWIPPPASLLTVTPISNETNWA